MTIAGLGSTEPRSAIYLFLLIGAFHVDYDDIDGTSGNYCAGRYEHLSISKVLTSFKSPSHEKLLTKSFF
jgi:hypothetical protein